MTGHDTCLVTHTTYLGHEERQHWQRTAFIQGAKIWNSLDLTLYGTRKLTNLKPLFKLLL